MHSAKKLEMLGLISIRKNEHEILTGVTHKIQLDMINITRLGLYLIEFFSMFEEE